MAEFSMLWETVTATGDGANEYSEDNAAFFFKDFTNAVPASMGVLSGIDNELVVTGSTSPLSVDTGKASVYQFRYQNTAIASIGVATPLIGDTGGRIILRADWALNTVRLYSKMNTDGNAAIPALTQVAGTTWEISLCSFVIATTGTIYTDASKGTTGVTDTRSYVISPLAGMVRLRQSFGTGASGTINWTGIQQDLRHLLIVGYCRSTGAGLAGNLEMTLNGIAGGNYDRSQIYANNATVVHSTNLAAAAWTIGNITAAGGVANGYDAVEILIPYYALASRLKTIQAKMNHVSDRAAANVAQFIVDGWWRQTAALNRITLTITPAGSFTTESVFTLYGLR